MGRFLRHSVYLIDHTLHRTAKPQLRHPGCDIHTRQAQTIDKEKLPQPMSHF